MNINIMYDPISTYNGIYGGYEGITYGYSIGGYYGAMTGFIVGGADGIAGFPSYSFVNR